MSGEKLYLATSEVLQGDLSPQDLNIMLIFQVNCPGCFIYGFPFANYLHKQFGPSGLKVTALSTAFEDYDFNTLENTRLLLSKKELVGETRRLLNESGYFELPYNVEFPVAFDDLQPVKSAGLTDEAVEKMCETLPDYQKCNYTEKKLIRGQVKEYLSNKKFSAATFDANNLPGTPSWVLFDKEYTVLGRWFGHQEHEEIERSVQRALTASP